MKDLRIDLGLSAEAVRRLVRLGDPITYAQEFIELRDGIYMGRNFDNRVGLYCLLQAMTHALAARCPEGFIKAVIVAE